jgi:histone-lysine N-methyltransferase MLL3
MLFFFVWFEQKIQTNELCLLTGFCNNCFLSHISDVHGGKSTPDCDPYAFPPLTPKSSASASPTTPTLGPRLSGTPRGLVSDPFIPSPNATHTGPPNSTGPPHSSPSMGDVFKHPMPQAASTQAHDPYAQQPSTPRPDVFSSRQSPGIRPPSDPYAMPPGTPRPGMEEHFKQSPGHPGLDTGCGPRPCGPGRFPTPPARGPESFPNNAASRVPTPSQGPSLQGMSMDPYAQPPGTPMPGSSQDPYAAPPGTPRAPTTPTDPYAQQPGTPMPPSSTQGEFHSDLPTMMPGGRPRFLHDPHNAPHTMVSCFTLLQHQPNTWCNTLFLTYR